MTTTTEFAAAGDFSVDAEARTVRGLLLPWGEQSRVSGDGTAPITFERGSVKVPQDVSVITANRHHDRYDPVGRATSVEDTDRGLVATFSIANTAEGDEFLEQYKTGTLRKLSGEFGQLVRNGAKAVSARLTGAGFVPEGAFASAALFAIGDPVEEEPTEEPTEATEHQETETTDEAGNTVKRSEDTTVKQDGNTTTTTTVVVETIEPAEAPTGGEATVPNATVPSTLNASAHTEKVDKATFLATVSAAVKDPGMLASLSDVKISGAGAVGTGITVPEFVNEIWSGKRFERKVIPLISSGTLTALTTQGWRWTTAPEVDVWAGNKADIPSNAPKTEPVTWGLQRFAGGWDIAREFIDFGVTDVLDSFLRLAADSYAKKSDNYVLAQLLTGATVGTVGTTPDGVGEGMAKIVRGALRVIANDATPSFALVAPDLYEDILFTKKDDTLAFLAMSLGLEEGSLESFKIVPHTGIDAGEVLVGDRQAAGAYELGGSPIRVNALDIARGGVDEALFGYIQTRIEYPTGLQLVTDNA